MTDTILHNRLVGLLSGLLVASACLLLLAR
jgi:hypothetical protein